MAKSKRAKLAREKRRWIFNGCKGDPWCRHCDLHFGSQEEHWRHMAELHGVKVWSRDEIHRSGMTVGVENG